MKCANFRWYPAGRNPNGLLLRWLCWGLFSLLLSTCKPTTKPLFERLDSRQTGIDFSNTLTESDSLNILTFEYFYNGGGVALGDINNDGLIDVFLGGNMVNSRLYLNKGNFRFEDITASAGINTADGWTTGLALVDINADGFLDLYVCRAGPHQAVDRRNQLYINQHNNTFTQEAQRYGLADTTRSTQAAFLDYDRDGDLDCYLVVNDMGTHGPNVIRPKLNDGTAASTDRLYQNNGHGYFTDVSAVAGIQKEGYGLGVAVVDINTDGWPDLYVANDYLSEDHLYINQRNGTFQDKLTDYFRQQSYSAMGTDAADIDNDALIDVMTVDMLPENGHRRKNMIGAMHYSRYLSERRAGYSYQFMRNTLQHNNGPNPNTGQVAFSEIGRMAGVEHTDWSWSVLMADYDNDGQRDIFITNGYPRDITNSDFVAYRMAQYQQRIGNQSAKQLFEALKNVSGAYLPNYVFRNGGNLSFHDVSADWGIDEPSYSNGAAYGDLDNDGDLDLVVNNLNQPAFVYRNRTNEHLNHHFLQIDLKGKSGNVSGVGAKVYVYAHPNTLYAEQSPYRGYESSVDARLHFGLGVSNVIDSIRVVWLSGSTQLLKNVQANQCLTLSEADSQAWLSKPQLKPQPVLKDITGQLGIQYRHIDPEYIDFNIQPMLPHLLSQEGPGIAVSDVNGDGRDDFFVGGAFNHSGHLFIQNRNQTFSGKPLILGRKYEEDMGCLLFDADSDGDNDLYVVSGSNEFPANSRYYQDRLYLNDGRGNFSLSHSALPPETISGSSVSAADFDRDGDLDLLVCGRLTPGQYPTPSASQLLRNDRGHFVNITATAAPMLAHLGMATTAIWTDFDNDGWTDVLMAGEWMPLLFLKNKQGILTDVSTETGLTNTRGWWNSLAAADFDQDGDMDYIAGNLGLNHPWQHTPQKPLLLLADDYDQNGLTDPLMAQYEGGELVPVQPRDELTTQVPAWRRLFPSYDAYANATILVLLTPEGQQKAYTLKAERFESLYIENKGQGHFTLKALPRQAQMAPIYGIVCMDVNYDGFTDLVLTGNSYAPEPVTSRYDAFNGLVLAGNGKGSFMPLRLQQSGFFVDGDAKGTSLLQLSNGQPVILTARNNGNLCAYTPLSSFRTFVFKPKPQDAYAEWVGESGHKMRIEFAYGSSYLSQSSRQVTIPLVAKGDTLTRLVVYTFEGSSRVIQKEHLFMGF